jgi:hypothetical protein
VTVSALSAQEIKFDILGPKAHHARVYPLRCTADLRFSQQRDGRLTCETHSVAGLATPRMVSHPLGASHPFVGNEEAIDWFLRSVT